MRIKHVQIHFADTKSKIKEFYGTINSANGAVWATTEIYKTRRPLRKMADKLNLFIHDKTLA